MKTHNWLIGILSIFGFLFSFNPLLQALDDNNILWAKKTGYIKSIANYDNGAFVVAGTLGLNQVFGEGEANETLLTSDGNAIFIAKYNEDGSLIWAKRGGGQYTTQVSDIDTYADGSCVVIGVFYTWTVFGAGEDNVTRLDSVGASDIFLARYNSDGTLDWAERIGGGRGYDMGHRVTTYADGSCVTLSYIAQTGAVPMSTDYDNIIIAKYNANGVNIWSRQISLDMFVRDRGGIASCQDGSSIITSSFNNTIILGIGEPYETELQSNGNSDIFIVKYNANGMLLWAKSFGSVSTDWGYDIASFEDGSSVLTGYCMGVTIARYNSDGTQAWFKCPGGAGAVYWPVYNIESYDDDSSLLVGRFHQTTIFGEGEINQTTLTPRDSSDCFLARYNSNGTLSWAKNWDYSRTIASHTDGSTLFTGSFQGTIVFGEGGPNPITLVSEEDSSTFIAKHSVVPATPSPTASPTPSPPPSVTPTPSPSPSPTPSVAPTPSPSVTPKPTVTPTPSPSPSVTPSPSPTSSVTPTPTVAPTSSPSPTVTPSLSPTPSVIPTPSITPTPSPTAYVPTPTPALTPESSGDEISIFRPSTGLWAVRDTTRVYFGGSDDTPVYRDYDGDGADDIAIFRGSSGLWAVRGITRAYFGGFSDEPVPSDYDGDGTTEIGVFRPSPGLWAVRGITRVYFGSFGDTPVPGDYDGDSSDDIGVYRGASGLWALRGGSRIYFGGSSDEPVPGDYTGDNTCDAGIFRGSSGLWAIRGVTRSYFGSSIDEPVPADYDGDSRDDIGIFRSSSGLWAIKGFSRAYFGAYGDIPITR